MVNHKSGLLGVSEISSDMRDLLAQEAHDIRAEEAVALFCYQAKKWIGSFAAAPGGLDTFVFAGGMGEDAPCVRARICAGLGFLGIELSESRNAEAAAVISTDASLATVRFISLFQACAESLASENASRLAAMQRAEKNIDELLEDLNRTFHRLRQGGIDEELFDVISGFEALSEKKKASATAQKPFNLTPRIATRAYELYQRRGRHDGGPDQDWLEAAREIAPKG